ncbi:hypothetical protein J7E97_33815 [Streptomyces sp. ISL-66]|uniref:hypothetical protein n=1 Tax=Streptomyces sp. ISL-66 TaxID=2819186 RepID=UPI001BE95D3A|nr:hypothetical protein [Streptomyces sp. ISL-66]MBT2472697.1 hypothetical protein [Streptomyces sp. ISL-66]
MGVRRGRTSRRRLLLMLGAPLVLAGTGFGVASALTGDEDPRHEIHTSLEPLNERFAEYTGELAEAHWQAYDIDDRGDRLTVPSPDHRIRVVGVARLRTGGAVKAMDGGATFFTATPKALPDRLKPYLPTDAQWLRSAHFDKLVAETDTEGPGGSEVCFDPQRDLMYFDLLSVG